MTGIYPVSERRFQPWKNGGGETAEILVSPPGADFAGFDWRISTAVVAQDGPFSCFEGVDRNLTVLQGGKMRLRMGGDVVVLDADSPPHAFAGDIACDATVLGETVLDFNVMVRRPLRAAVTRGPLAVGSGPARARYALLLEPSQGLARLDLVDLHACGAERIETLLGTYSLMIEVFG